MGVGWLGEGWEGWLGEGWDGWLGEGLGEGCISTDGAGELG